jgi:hypothetical protein
MSENLNASAVQGISTVGSTGTRKVRKSEIEALEASLEEFREGNSQKVKNLSSDMYKDEDGNVTHYYKNISTTDIIFNHPAIGEFKKGSVINLAKIFNSVDDIVNFRDISKLLQPIGDDPALVRRLTPEEYYEELRRAAEIESKKKSELLSRNKSISHKSKAESVSDVVSTQLNQLSNYLSLSEERRSETNYTIYDFISWLNSYNFNRAEYDLMMYTIKDSEVLHALQLRKHQLIKYGLFSEVSDSE